MLAESCTICSSRSRRPVRKLLDTPNSTSNYRAWRYPTQNYSTLKSRLSNSGRGLPGYDVV